MATETLRCPQCGGVIAFAGYQTQALCPYCGTTVDKPRPAEPIAGDGLDLAPAPAPRLADLPRDPLIRLTRLVMAGEQADALAFVRQNLGLDEAPARAQLADEAAWLPRLNLLATEQLAQLQQLVFDGQEAEALTLIQDYLGLDAAHGRQQLDEQRARWADRWRSQYRQKAPGSNGAVALLVGNVAITLLGTIVLVALAVGALTTMPKLGVGVIGVLGFLFGLSPVVCPAIIVWYAVSLVVGLLTYSGARARVLRMLGRPTPAVLLKVAKLNTGPNVVGPAVTTTHLQVRVTPRAGAPQVIDKVFDLPPAAADRLQPGLHIEVITNGPGFTYITEPIKIAG
jgi:hypothetical protein